MVQWEKLGRLLAPDPSVVWMTSHCGASFARPQRQPGHFEVYVTGRDTNNRSMIGRVELDLSDAPRVLIIEADPVLTPGQKGAFDENGVSYPYLVENGVDLYMLYVGWMPTVLTPFQNHLGMAVQGPGGEFARVSRAPILERNDDDFLSIGSACCFIEDGLWRLWYTSFLSWARTPEDPKHHYVIKYAESTDGRAWKRLNVVCIGPRSIDEYSIGRPTVIRLGYWYHMWFSYRGDQYQIGYARSRDGLEWERRDDLLLPPSRDDHAWDSISQCYPHVFQLGTYLYMLYCGNDYGRGGLGLASLAIDRIGDGA